MRTTAMRVRFTPSTPRGTRSSGKKPIRPCLKIGEPIDLAVIMTRIDSASSIVRECGELNAAGTVIISSGGKEAGEKGVAIEAEILKEAQKGGVRVVGPNCLGVINTRSRMNASFGHVLPKAGKLAFVSQSGGTTTALLDFAVTEDIGFSYFISVGTMLDVDFGDVLGFLGDDPGTEAILVYAESITNHGKFLKIAKGSDGEKADCPFESGPLPRWSRGRAVPHRGPRRGRRCAQRRLRTGRNRPGRYAE